MLRATIAGKALKDWETTFKERIEGFLKEDRLPIIVPEVVESRTQMGVVYKRRGQSRIASDQSGTTIIMASPTIENMKPTRIRSDDPIEIWISDPKVNLDFLFRDLSREIAERETRTILDCLERSGSEFKVKQGRVTWEMLSGAYDSISGNLHHPDTLVVHPFVEAEMMKSNEFIPFWRLAKDTRTARREHFSGILGPAEVYWTPSVEPNTLFFFERMEVRARTSDLTVEFDSYQNPKNLVTSEDFLAWAIDDTAVARIMME